MLDILEHAKKCIKSRSNPDVWNSLFINYHPPIVERLWIEWSAYRINLHYIHPCKDGEALMHPHNWPSAMEVLHGKYLNKVGYGTEPVITEILTKGSQYEMVNKKTWHSVTPIGEPAISLMVTGSPWDKGKKSDIILGPLSAERKVELLSKFEGLI